MYFSTSENISKTVFVANELHRELNSLLMLRDYMHANQGLTENQVNIYMMLQNGIIPFLYIEKKIALEDESTRDFIFVTFSSSGGFQWS